MTLRDDFAAAIAGPDSAVDLFGAALVIARLSGHSVTPGRCVRRLGDMAEAVLLHAGNETGVEAMTQAIDHHMFNVLGFRGNSNAYNDPRNSYIDLVLDRRVGLPITLSLVYMEIARRVGLRCDGVGYPGHFIVRCGEPEDGLFVDPFHQGARLDRTELIANLRGTNMGGASAESYLSAVTSRQVLQRMLLNLRNTFQESKDIESWHACVDLLLCIEPWNASLTGERGMLAFRLGDSSGALDDLERYVGATSPGTTSGGARRLLQQLRIQLGSEERL